MKTNTAVCLIALVAMLSPLANATRTLDGEVPVAWPLGACHPTGGNVTSDTESQDASANVTIHVDALNNSCLP